MGHCGWGCVFNGCSEEEEVEILSQNVKACTVKGEGSCREAIPSIVDAGKEPIQAQSQLVQSTAPKEPIQSQSSLMPRRLKRVKAFKYITLSVYEKGRDIITCNHCQNVIHVGREKASCKKVPEVCFTIPEEEEVETSRNVKARTVKGTTEATSSEQYTNEQGREGTTQKCKIRIKELCKWIELDSREQMKKTC